MLTVFHYVSWKSTFKGRVEFWKCAYLIISSYFFSKNKKSHAPPKNLQQSEVVGVGKCSNYGHHAVDENWRAGGVAVRGVAVRGFFRKRLRRYAGYVHSI